MRPFQKKKPSRNVDKLIDRVTNAVEKQPGRFPARIKKYIARLDAPHC